MRFPTMPLDLPSCNQGPFVLSPMSQSYSPFGLPQAGSLGGHVVRIGGNEGKEAVGEREVRGFSSPRETQPG